MTKWLLLLSVALTTGWLASLYRRGPPADDNFSVRSTRIGTSTVFLVEPEIGRPWPVTIFLSSRPVRKEALVRLARAGVIAVSLPLDNDFAGPASFRSAEGVLDWLRLREDVRADKIAIVGIDDGATLAGLVALREPSLAGALMIGGVYNLSSAIKRNGLEKSRARFGVPLNDVDRRRRSVLHARGKMRVPLLVVNGTDDPWITDSEMESWMKRLRSRGVPARFERRADVAELLNPDEEQFLASVLK